MRSIIEYRKKWGINLVLDINREMVWKKQSKIDHLR